MQETANFSQFAKLVGYSESMVRKWISEGVITKFSLDYDNPKRPTIIIENAKKELAKNRRPSINSEPEKRGRPKVLKHKEVGPFGEKELVVENLDLQNLTFDQMFAMSLTQLDKLKKIAEFDRLRIENQRKMKLLVPKELVDKELFESAQILKSAFESIPSRIIDLLMAETDRDKAIILLEDEIDLAFNNVADAQDRLNNALENYE